MVVAVYRPDKPALFAAAEYTGADKGGTVSAEQAGDGRSGAGAVAVVGEDRPAAVA